MAMVDFSNAKLNIPASGNILETSGYAGTLQSLFCNASGQQINTNQTVNILIDAEKNIEIGYTGEFTQSGNEFYIKTRTNVNENWKITGVSFQAGDTYSFQIPTTLTCN